MTRKTTTGRTLRLIVTKSSNPAPSAPAAARKAA